MALKVAPIDMVSSPNTFYQVQQWSITGGNSSVLWFQLQISDSLGVRRYMPQSGATVQVQFPRARSLDSLQVSQTVAKAGTFDSNDRSLWKVTLTETDTQSIISGTVKFVLTEGSSSQTIVQNYFISRSLTGAGH